MKGRETMWKPAIILGAAIALVALGAACGDDDDDEASPTPSVCDQKDALEASVQDLTDLDIIASGTDGLTEAVNNVKEDLQGLKSAVSTDVQPEVEALETAVSDAEDTLGTIDSDSSLNEKIDAVQEAVTGVATAVEDLQTSLQNDCP
jgi:DNA repair ATPase RecN